MVCRLVPTKCPTAKDVLAVGWISATRGLGDAFNFRPLYVIHLVMTVIVCVTWVTLLVLTVVAFWQGVILMSTVEDVLRDQRGGPGREMGDVEKGPREPLSSSKSTSLESRAMTPPPTPRQQVSYMGNEGRASSCLP